LQSFDEYQVSTAKFRLPSYNPQAAVMGLLSEAGEVAGVFQKMIRGDFNADVAVTKLRKELGDMMWHISEVASDNGWSMAEIAQENIDKLESRQIRNVIIGAGDDR
jgi:NTP pyrophosphatase (non-canonical NTP hydrolase)